MIKKLSLEVIVFLLAALYAYTAYTKLTDHFTYKIELKMSPVLHPIANLSAWVIPIVEALVVLLLIEKRSRLWGLYASAWLLTIFTIYLLGLALFSGELPCSCGGFISTLSFGEHILLNLTFLTLSVAGIRLMNHKRKNQHQNTRYTAQSIT